MTVCSFFLQGRCRYGEKCWNEHPRGGNRGGGGGGGGGGGFNNSYNSRSSGQQQSRGGGGGGYGNRVWVHPSQQKGGFIQSSSVPHGGDDWSRGGGGRRDNIKASDFSFSSGDNRFSALNAPNTFDRGRRGGVQPAAGGDEDDDRKLETIQADMEVWESSGQWGFSCYSNSKASLSGFADHSPEEIRLEYYTSRASGDLQGYLNGINQLLSQWRSRVQELKLMRPPTRAAVLAELNNPTPSASTGGFLSAGSSEFGSSTFGFGSKGFGAPAPVQASTFSFAASNSGVGSSAAPSSSTGFGTSSFAPSQPPAGFGSTPAPSSAVSASSFSFAAPTSSTPAASSGFGSAAGFTFSSTGGGGFGSGLGAKDPAAPGGSSGFGQTSGGFGSVSAPPAAASGSVSAASDSLFSPEDKLTPEELNQFKAKRFTLGQIPLKPPPADMLLV